MSENNETRVETDVEQNVGKPSGYFLFDAKQVPEAPKKEPKDKLRELALSLKEKNIQKKQNETELKALKDEFKSLAKELGVDSYKDEDVKVSISEISKISFDSEGVIQVLKQRGLDKYIHTKEYFDEAEIAMAITKNELKAEEIKPFMSETNETRINIR